MLQYILECISFQLIFLIIYDFFLKKETFFQWNRLYLLGTHVLSLILPWIKIEAFKTEVPTEYFVYPEFLWNMDSAPITGTANESSILNISWQQGVFFLGLLGATLLFGYKMHQLYRLRKNGDVHYFLNFTRIIVANSNLAFSFFKSIFLGDKVLAKEQENIIKHELVHIQQKHSWDLLFFELLRIVFWFNPLVYVYQSRISELHEFIADAHVAKTNKKEQYQLLLSQVFQTQHISFVNQFFKTSLIKKRIAMLQKSKSKKVWQLKYLLLVPMVVGMLFYTSLEGQEIKELDKDKSVIYDQSDKEQIAKDLQNENSEEIERQLKELMDKMIVNKEILSRQEYSRFKVLSYQAFSKPKIEILKDDTLYYLGSVKPFKNPTNKEYKSYVNRTKTFQILDFDLGVSIDHKELNIRKIEKKDKNLGPGDFILVKNVRDLTKDEIININRKIASIDFNKRFLFLSDNENAFLITKMIKDGLDDIDDKNKIAAISTKDSVNPFAVADEIPIFPGCEGENDSRGCFQKMLQKHISKHFRYPKEAQLLGIQGRVSIMFTIDENGNITDIRKRGPHKLLEAEAERIITLLPKMTPGKHDGKTVNIPFSIPIAFKLGSEDAEQRKEFQNSQDDMDVPFAVVDQVPVFPGCESDDDKRGCFQESMREHIRKNFRYPEEAQKLGIQGRVSVIFILDKNGDIAHIRKKGPHKLLEEEAVRIISLLPKIKPGMHDGIRVNVPFSIPITFKLQGDSIDSSEKFDIMKEQDLQGIKKEDFPLVFIDGKESTQMEVYELQKNNLIESITVLKDKNKLIMYGAKGENGVIKVSTKKMDLGTMSVSAYTKIEGQKKYISGKVTDGSRGLPGVNVIVQGGNKAVVSNFDGEFTIEVQKGDIITFQYIGLPTAALTVTDQEIYLVTASK